LVIARYGQQPHVAYDATFIVVELKSAKASSISSTHQCTCSAKVYDSMCLHCECVALFAQLVWWACQQRSFLLWYSQ
jgi:hypothetical protein